MKSDAQNNYWRECLTTAAEDSGFSIPDEQLAVLADAVESGHENYSMAFYSPPPSDRMSGIEREWKSKLSSLQREFDGYRKNAERAVKIALHQHSDSQVSIGEYGEVTRFGGRIERIQ